QFTIADDFPPASYEQWRSLAEADLKGAMFEQKLVTCTYDGIDIQPLYTRRDQLDPNVLSASGAVQKTWDLLQEYAHPDIKVANRAILDDLNGGATSILLQLDSAARNGIDAHDPAFGDLARHDGLMAYTLDDFDALLAGVELNFVPICLDAVAAFLPAAAMLM